MGRTTPSTVSDKGVKIGATGFEPATSWSQTKRSTKLSYAPDAGTPYGREPIGEREKNVFPRPQSFREAMSIEKRYFTSERSIRP